MTTPAAASCRKAFDEYCSRKSAIADVEGAVDLPLNKNPTIEFDQVSFTYGGTQILDKISFKVKGGQTVGTSQSMNGLSALCSASVIRHQ